MSALYTELLTLGRKLRNRVEFTETDLAWFRKPLNGGE